MLSYSLVCVLPHTSALAFEASPLNIPYTDQAIVIDGEIDDQAWENALVVSLDIVNKPYDNTPAPVKTTARIIENGEFIYVSFIAEDPEPHKIQSALGDRDTKWTDDIVGVKIDSLDKRRNSYNFYVNAWGVQNDEIYDEINQEVNHSWDAIWQSYGKITPQGYQVEIALPFNLFNFEQSSDIKTWPIELMRLYPRDTKLRLSHVPLDRDNNCWVCQYPHAVGFKRAKLDNNLTLTPSVVLSKDQERDIYDNNSEWEGDNETEVSLDVRWGITPSNLLNVTVNPDFSTVESDSGQLSINETFSLFFDEKRPFFTENAEYFSSPLDLVYTRNIATPDYGAKFTGSSGQHNYGAFISHDSQTNFILSGNLSARVASLNEESHSGALRYRYDATDDITFGVISTLRQADTYHNYVTGVDGSYRISPSDLFTAQWLISETEYPDGLVNQFCSFNCRNEQALRSEQSGAFNGHAFNAKYTHDSEDWQFIASHEGFSDGFQADLGFIPRTDYSKNLTSLTRWLYNDDTNGFWQEMALSSEWNIQHNDQGEFIAKEMQLYWDFDGPSLSAYEFSYIVAERVGLRDQIINNGAYTLAIDNNTDRFTEHQFKFYAHVRPTNKTFLSIESTVGDKIDYENNRLGSYYTAKANITWNITDHIEFDLYHTVSELKADNQQLNEERVFLANLTDLRVTYHFDVYSYLKLSAVYSDIEQNPENNPFSFFNKQEKILETQLIYAYKLNPQTAFYLGYSDSSYQDDFLARLERERRTFFAKLSYAWQP